MPAKRLSRTTPAPKPGIVHLGPGAFFRAFNAVYTADAMEAEGGDWGIIAVSLQSPTARDQLAPQDNLYTSATLGPKGAEYRVIPSLNDVLVAPEDPSRVIDAMVAETTKIVSLTVTEKGYCHEPATGRLNLSHPDIVHDLASDRPKSALGFIVAAIKKRKELGIVPFTVMTCDNLPSNGHLLRRLVIEYAAQQDAKFSEWIAENIAFPATMVDRITPATTASDVEALESAQGYHDPACVQHEPFRQWVIEDKFPNGRPAWDKVGAQMVNAVEAHENMKLRCLNGTHSTLAYLGYLGGYETIAETVADPSYAKLCQILWANEIIPTLEKPEGEDLPAYADALLERYRNPSIRHRTWQIAMDGSQKLPQRILGTIRDARATGRNTPGLILAVAGWMRYISGVDEKGNPIDVKDPLAADLRAASDSADSLDEKVAALLSIRKVFDEKLANDPAFKADLITAYLGLAEHGAKEMVKRFTA